MPNPGEHIPATEERITLAPHDVEGFRRAIRHALTSVGEMQARLAAMAAEFEREAKRLRDLLVQAEVLLCSTCGSRIPPGAGCPPGDGYRNWHCERCREAHDLY